MKTSTHRVASGYWDYISTTIMAKPIKTIKIGILDVVNPTEIDRKEYIWMHRLNTFQPVGINTKYPFEIPYL